MLHFASAQQPYTENCAGHRGHRDGYDIILVLKDIRIYMASRRKLLMHWEPVYSETVRPTVLFYHDSTELPYFLCWPYVSLVFIMSISRNYKGPYFPSHFLVRYDNAILLKQNHSQLSEWGWGGVGGMTYQRFVFPTHMKPNMIREHRLFHMVTWRSRISGLLTSCKEMVKPACQLVLQWKGTPAFNHCYPGVTHMIFACRPLVITCNKSPN